MKPAELIRYLVLAAQREGNRQLTDGLRPLGLSSSQAEVLRILGDHEPLTLGGLGEMLVCESGGNPSRLVDRLVVTGLVERIPGQTDRRQVTLTLTSAGRQAELGVRAVENQLYARLELALADTAADTAVNVDVDGLIETLQRFSAGSLPGNALEARRSRSASPTV